MAKAHVLVLGAGFGGLEVAALMSEQAPEDVEVTLIDKSPSFVFGFSKIDVLFGRRQLSQVSARYDQIRRPSVTFRLETVVGIDPDARLVTTDGGRYRCDVLVVALGADLDPAATPGLVAGGHEFYSVEGAARLAGVLPAFEGGDVVVGVMGTPFKCPPAPSETALLLHEYLGARGRRGAATITVVSPLATPLPPSPGTSTAILAAFGDRDIAYVGDRTVTGLDPVRRAVALSDGAEIGCDLLLGVPLHRAPRVLAESGLLKGGWVGVDRHTLATPFPGVYALGDVANAPVPRAGTFAESAARVVSQQILAELRGGPTEPYDGFGQCYIEFGGGLVGRVDMTFMAPGGPRGPFALPSEVIAEEKHRSATARLERWFGRPPESSPGSADQN